MVISAGLANPDRKTRPSNCKTDFCSIQFAGMAGGRILAQAGRMGPPAILATDLALLWGDVVQAGGTADIAGAVSSSRNMAITGVYASHMVTAPVKLPAPFRIGHLGLDASGLVFVGHMKHEDASQSAALRVKVPTGLRGLQIPIQGLSQDKRNGTLAFTNTAWVTVR